MLFFSLLFQMPVFTRLLANLCLLARTSKPKPEVVFRKTSENVSLQRSQAHICALYCKPNVITHLCQLYVMFGGTGAYFPVDRKG